LLHLLLALLHLLHDLLGRAGRETGVDDGRWLRGWRLIVGVVIIAVVDRGAFGDGLRGRGRADAEQDLARGSPALIADHDDVISRTLQQLGEDIARPAGAVCAEDTLIGAQAFHLCAGGGGDIVEYLLQAGVRGIDAENLTVPYD
jgi:hypothetical protein